MDALKTITVWDAAQTLAPWLGVGWLTAMVVAYFGYRSAKLKSAPPTLPGPIAGLASLYVDRLAIEQTINLGEKLADAIKEHTESVHALKRSIETHAHQMELASVKKPR